MTSAGQRTLLLNERLQRTPISVATGPVAGVEVSGSDHAVLRDVSGRSFLGSDHDNCLFSIADPADYSSSRILNVRFLAPKDESKGALPGLSWH